MGERATFLKAARGRGWPRSLIVALSSLLTTAIVACGGGNDLPGGAGSYGGESGQGGVPPIVPCTDGEARACSITLGLHGDVLSCYEGTQRCEAGVWGACTDGTTLERRYTASEPGARPQSIGGATVCDNNP